MPHRHIAILGGGLTGLSAAFHLSRRYPAAAITLLEKSSRLGGWVHSERVNVADGNGNRASILLERGPRTLRPNGKSVLELINLLNLGTSVITVPKTSAAARTRFLHIPGTTGLTALPSSLSGVLFSRFGRRIVRGASLEPLRGLSATSAEAEDDSVEHFLAARLGPELARTLGSALVHGIYAADSRELSVRAAFPSLWDAARRGKGSILLGSLLPGPSAPSEAVNDYDLGDVQDLMRDTSVYSFRDGMSTLVQGMVDAIERQPNVNIMKDAQVASLDNGSQNEPVTVHTASGNAIPVTHVVSTIPLPALKTILDRSPGTALPHLDANPTSSVTVVNLVFPHTPKDQPIHPEGFGYLIPRSKDGLVEVLGTVFDACALGVQDEYPSADAPRFTKMTMMIRATSSSPPVTEHYVLDKLAEHLQPTSPIPTPVFFQAHTMRGCIPTPTVGHVLRMEEMKRAASERWHGRLEVIGAGVGGVSVADCIEQGRQAGRR